jgi:hypothetical protein
MATQARTDDARKGRQMMMIERGGKREMMGRLLVAWS